MRRASSRFLLRLGVSLTLLGSLSAVVDMAEVLGLLADLRLRWVAAALALSVLQVVLSAWRWRYTAARLDIELPPAVAVAEYYMATFLNQVLPGGVLGDVSRAWRHARTVGAQPEGRTPTPRAPPVIGGTAVVEPTAVAEGTAVMDRAAVADRTARRLRSVHAVVLERASGQAVMTMAALIAGAALLLPRTEATSSVLPGHPLSGVPAAVSIPSAVAAAVAAAWLLGLLLRRMVRLPVVDRLIDHARRALLGSALPVQAAASLAIVTSYVLVFLMAARAVGVTTPAAALAFLAPPVLVTMLIPVSVAGWGVREAAAALLWSAVGLTSSQGVAVSVAYGAIVLLSSLPGAAVLVGASGGRSRPMLHNVGRGGDAPLGRAAGEAAGTEELRPARRREEGS